MRKLLLFVFLLFALINRGLAQTGYPIFVTPTLTPPYSLKLSEYSKFGSQRMVVNIAVNDLNISNLPVKLHIKLETVGVTIETPVTINTTPIYLDGGAVTILFGDDLTDYFNINNLIFKGYSKEAYRRTGQLPEGFYKITVEVLHYQTNRLISNSGAATAWITLGKPPVLKLPENNKVLGEFKGMPLTFSWLPCNLGNPVSAGSVQYKFEMWELRIDGVSPYVVASTVPVFYEETTSNTLLSVFPATMLMEPGMKYAWRVTASDMLGNVPFEQDGHSEIRVFSYKSKCDSVTNFKADARGRSGLFGWQPKSNHTSYNVELRNPETGWLSASETFDSKVEFHDLDYGSTYEIRTQAVCDNDPSSLSDFTAWHRLTINNQRTKPDSASCPNCGCDDNIIPKEIENLELNRNLKPGDTLVNRAGTTRFIVKTATQQGDGVYKGIFLFWAELWKVKFVCEYWDLSANTDNVILNMDFKSVYNPQFLLDVDVMTAYLDSLASAITTLTINTTISDTLTVNGSISTVYVNEGDSVIVVTVGENGELTEIVIGTNSDDLGHTLITGEDGEEYVVTGNGEVMGVDEFKNTGGNDRKIEEYKEEKESHLSATTVNFAASPTQKYGFDAYTEQKQALRNGYPALGNGYVPSYKSVASFATDKVVPSSFEKGITFRDEMGIPAVATGGELTLRGRADGSVTSLYAYKALTDTTEEVAGKLEVMSYDQQVKKLYIVPVNNAKLPDVTALQNVLNTVYAQAVTRWEVVPIKESVPVTFPNGQMTHGGSSAIAVYNADQNAIISKFKEKNNLESNALYLFFVDNVVGKTGDVAGYMPLQRQVGFIYDSPNLFVIAHELGHGAFNLRHTFSSENFIAAEHSTQNLMDYNGGTELWKHQWELIRDPQSVWFAWAQDEKEGQAIQNPVDEGYFSINDEKWTDYAFLSPVGTAIQIEGVSHILFNEDGAVLNFFLKGKKYYGVFSPSTQGFLGYLSSDDKNILDDNQNIKTVEFEAEFEKKKFTQILYAPVGKTVVAIYKKKYNNAYLNCIVKGLWTNEKVSNTHIGVAKPPFVPENVTNFELKGTQCYDAQADGVKDGVGVNVYFGLIKYIEQNIQKTDLVEFANFLTDTLNGKSFAFYGELIEETYPSSTSISYETIKFFSDNSIFNKKSFYSKFKYISKARECDIIFSIKDLWYDVKQGYAENTPDFILSKKIGFKVPYEYSFSDLKTREKYRENPMMFNGILSNENDGTSGALSTFEYTKQYKACFGTSLAIFAWAKFFAENMSDVYDVGVAYEAVRLSTNLFKAVKPDKVLLKRFIGVLKKLFGDEVVETLIRSLKSANLEGLAHSIRRADNMLLRENALNKRISVQAVLNQQMTEVAYFAVESQRLVVKNALRKAEDVVVAEELLDDNLPIYDELGNRLKSVRKLELDNGGVVFEGTIAEFGDDVIKTFKVKFPSASNIFNELKNVKGKTCRAGTFWTAQGDNIVEKVSSDGRFLLKHDKISGEVLFADLKATDKPFLGYYIDEITDGNGNFLGRYIANGTDAEYNTVFDNLKLIHGFGSGSITVGGKTIPLVEGKTNIILGKFKDNEGLGFITTKQIFDKLTMMKYYETAENISVATRRVHLLNIPDLTSDGKNWWNYFNNPQIQDIIKNSEKYNVIILADPGNAKIKALGGSFMDEMNELEKHFRFTNIGNYWTITK